MNRRELLTRGMGFVALSASLAGCGDDGTNAEDGTDDSEDTESEFGDGPSEVGESGLQRKFTVLVDTVELLAVEEVEVTESRVEVDITLRNTADEPVELWKYAIRLHLYETEEPTSYGEDEMMSYTGTSREFDNDDRDPVPPGEYTTLRYSIVRSNRSDTPIGSYEVYINCARLYDLPCEGGV